MHPSPEILNDLVHRLVDAVHPTRVIPFGSAARGEMNEHSDLDVLVLPDSVAQKDGWELAFRSLRRLGVPTDLVVVKEGVSEKHGEAPGSVSEQALHYGVELYHAA